MMESLKKEGVVSSNNQYNLIDDPLLLNPIRLVDYEFVHFIRR